MGGKPLVKGRLELLERRQILGVAEVKGIFIHPEEHPMDGLKGKGRVVQIDDFD